MTPEYWLAPGSQRIRIYLDDDILPSRDMRLTPGGRFGLLASDLDSCRGAGGVRFDCGYAHTRAGLLYDVAVFAGTSVEIPAGRPAAFFSESAFFCTV